MCRCPAHDDRNPSLSVSDTDDGRLLVHCFAGCPQDRVIDALKARGLWPASSAGQRPASGHRPKPRLETQIFDCDDARRSAAALKIWGAGKPAAATIVQEYLKSRGIYLSPPRSLRYVPALRYTPPERTLPAMVAAVQAPTGKIVAIHRTYLDPQTSRKAAVDSPKKALGRFGGGSVRLGPVSATLGLAEGIETGLSAMQLFDIPVWCSLGSRHHQVMLPESVRRVVVFSDNGQAGQRAAMAAVNVFTNQGRWVTLRFPSDEYGDWNDFLQSWKK
jgi:putative DNA primase/helicase